MPIVDVEIVLRFAKRLQPGTAAALADALGEVFAAAPGTTWVKLRVLAAEDYAENGGPIAGDALPVFVSVLKRRRPSAAEMQGEVDRITAAVARTCGRSAENVHVCYEADGAGRVAFGGRIVE